MKIFSMYKSYSLPLYILTENTVNQTTIIPGAVAPKTDITTHKPHTDNIPYMPLLLSPIFLMFVWAMTKFILGSNARKSPHNGKVSSSTSHEVPCRNCQFFKDNHYLNCAVHPSTVLTKQALNCADYLPNSSTHESEFTDDYFR